MWQIRINTFPALSWCPLSWVHIVLEQCELLSWFRLPIPDSYLTGTGTKRLKSLNFIVQFGLKKKSKLAITFIRLVWCAPTKVQNVLLGQTELVLQCPFLGLQQGHTGVQLLDCVLHVPLLHAVGPWMSLTETRKPGGHPDTRTTRWAQEYRAATFRPTFYRTWPNGCWFLGCYLRSFCSCVRACCLRLPFSSCSLMHRSSRCSLGSRNRRWGSCGEKNAD